VHAGFSGFDMAWDAPEKGAANRCDAHLAPWQQLQHGHASNRQDASVPDARMSGVDKRRELAERVSHGTLLAHATAFDVAVYVHVPESFADPVEWAQEKVMKPADMAVALQLSSDHGDLASGVARQARIRIIEACPYRFAVFDIVTKDVLGFLLCSLVETGGRGEIHVELLCSSGRYQGVARLCVERLMSFAAAQTYDVMVDAILPVLLFFAEHGFGFRTSCRHRAPDFSLKADAVDMDDAVGLLETGGELPVDLPPGHNGLRAVVRLVKAGLASACSATKLPGTSLRDDVQAIMDSQCFREGFHMRACAYQGDWPEDHVGDKRIKSPRSAAPDEPGAAATDASLSSPASTVSSLYRRRRVRKGGKPRMPPKVDWALPSR
jgi:hypothetical protein